jgi:hypothetical protein
MPGAKEDIEKSLGGACCPVGHCYTLVLASLTKRLLTEEMPAAYRLQFLQHLDKMPNGESKTWLTAEMIAAVEPMCDKGYEMVCEAQKLGPKKALDAYAKFFSAFAALNPSLIEVLKMSPTYQYHLKRAAAIALVASLTQTTIN